VKRSHDHLTESEIVDHIDGTLPSARAAHLDVCASCTERASSLRDAIGSIAHADDAGVPEPSPLFWDHFSRRVHDAVGEADPAPSSLRQLAGRWTGWAAAAVMIALAVVFFRPAQVNEITRPAREVVPAPAAAAAADATVDLDDDADWALVRMIAEDLDWDGAPQAGIAAEPGAADAVALELSADERGEVARLIEAALASTKDSGA
jgi:hypothetical protein